MYYATCSVRIGVVLASLLLHVPARAQVAGGADLLRQAEALDRANRYEAAQAAYERARAAYAQANDLAGLRKSLTELAALNERLADQYLRQASAAGPATPPAARPAAPVVVPAVPPAVAPVAGRVAGGRPLGLFFMTRYMIAWHSLQKATWYFAPNGQVFYNPGSLDAAGYAALAPGDRGMYQPGTKPVIKWANGNTTDFQIEPTGASSFNWDGGIFVGMGPFKSAGQLVGAFEGGNSVSGAAAVSGLELRADGSYSSSAVASVSSNTGASDVRVGSSGSTTGRWSLSGWTLTLRDNAGPTTSSVAYPIELDAKTGQVVRFYFNNVAYKRR